MPIAMPQISQIAKSLESRIGIFLGHQGEKESKLHLPLRKEVLHWLFGLLHWLFGSLHWLLEVLFWLLEELLGLLELLAGFPKERVLDMRGR